MNTTYRTLHASIGLMLGTIAIATPAPAFIPADLLEPQPASGAENCANGPWQPLEIVPGDGGGASELGLYHNGDGGVLVEWAMITDDMGYKDAAMAVWIQDENDAEWTWIAENVKTKTCWVLGNFDGDKVRFGYHGGVIKETVDEECTYSTSWNVGGSLSLSIDLDGPGAEVGGEFGLSEDYECNAHVFLETHEYFDGDSGWYDLPHEPLPQCIDDVDNDGDGLYDFEDPGCGGFSDNDEWNAPPPAPVVATPETKPYIGSIDCLTECVLPPLAFCGYGVVCFREGRTVPVNGMASVRISDELNNPVAAIACQDLDADSLCGEEAELRLEFCNSGWITQAKGWRPDARLYIVPQGVLQTVGICEYWFPATMPPTVGVAGHG